MLFDHESAAVTIHIGVFPLGFVNDVLGEL